MKTIKIAFVSICVVSIMVTISIALFFWTGGIFGDCSKAISSTKISPDGNVVATISIVDCGATTRLAKHVNISFGTKNDQKSLFVVETVNPMELEWMNQKTLKISFDVRDRNSIFKQMSEIDGIKIIYSPF